MSSPDGEGRAPSSSWVSPFDSATLGELVQRRADLHGDKLAFRYLTSTGGTAGGLAASDEMTFGELAARARAIAAGLAAASCHVGDRVLIVMPPCLDLIAAFFGSLRAGAVAVLAPPGERGRARRWLVEIVRHAQPTIVVHQRAREVADLLAEAGVTQCRAVALESLERAGSDGWREPAVEGASPALLQYTSGSTGRPKGTLVTHANLLYNSRQIYRCFHLTSKSRGLLWLPPYHDMGLIGGLVQPLYGGFECSFLPPVTIARRPMDWLRAISELRATSSGGPDFAYDLCARELRPEALEGVDLGCWEVAFTGAEPIRAQTLSRFAAAFAPYGFRAQAFLPCYGLAESTLLVTAGRKLAAPTQIEIDPATLGGSGEAVICRDRPGGRRLVSCGRPVADTWVVIVDPEGCTALPAGRVGEVWVAGPGVAAGYFRDLEATRRTFEARLAVTGEGPFLRTGDLGFLHNAKLFVTGRLKDLIIVRGVNHHPEDIEETAQRASPLLAPGRCAAFAIDRGDGESLAIAQELTRRALREVPSFEKVALAIRRRVTVEHRVRVEALTLLRPGSLPRTANGKVSRRACRDAFAAGELREVLRWQAVPAAKRPVTDDRPPAAAQDVGLPELGDLAGAELREELARWLEAWIGAALDVPDSGPRRNQHLAAYGLDSLLAAKLAREIAEWLGEPLEDTLLWDYPNITALSTYLAERRESRGRIRSHFETGAEAER